MIKHLMARLRKQEAGEKVSPVTPPPPPDNDPTSIGSILIEMGVSASDIRAALSVQSAMSPSLPLGEILTRMGSCSACDIASALDIQNEIRNGRSASASLSLLQAKTREMRENADRICGMVKDASKKAREHNENTGLFLVSRA